MGQNINIAFTQIINNINDCIKNKKEINVNSDEYLPGPIYRGLKDLKRNLDSLLDSDVDNKDLRNIFNALLMIYTQIKNGDEISIDGNDRIPSDIEGLLLLICGMLNDRLYKGKTNSLKYTEIKSRLEHKNDEIAAIREEFIEKKKELSILREKIKELEGNNTKYVPRKRNSKKVVIVRSK